MSTQKRQIGTTCIVKALREPPADIITSVTGITADQITAEVITNIEAGTITHNKITAGTIDFNVFDISTITTTSNPHIARLVPVRFNFPDPMSITDELMIDDEYNN